MILVGVNFGFLTGMDINYLKVMRFIHLRNRCI